MLSNINENLKGEGDSKLWQSYLLGEVMPLVASAGVSGTCMLDF